MLAKGFNREEVTHPPAFLRGPASATQPERPVVGTFHPKSGYIYGHAPNLFERMQQNEFDYRRQNNLYYPFQDQSEWELGRFICETMTGSDAERFFKLPWVCTN